MGAILVRQSPLIEDGEGGEPEVVGERGQVGEGEIGKLRGFSLLGGVLVLVGRLGWGGVSQGIKRRKRTKYTDNGSEGAGRRAARTENRP